MLTPRPAIARMKPYHPPLEGRRDFLRLDFNENSRGCSPRVVEALRTIDAHEIATYPEYNAFKSKLAAFAGLPEENILPTNASDEGIQTVFQTFLDPGSEVVLPVPTFAMFRFYAEILDLPVREVLYNTDLSFPETGVLSAITERTRAVVLVNPNNPTGTAIQRNAIFRILDVMKDRLVLLDEAYVEFHGETLVDQINAYPNLVILRTFSKSFGLAGLRLGLVLSHAGNIGYMTKAHSPYSISGLTVRLGMAALDDTASVRDYAFEISRSKERLAAALKAMGVRSWPSSANFLLAYFGDRSRAVEAALKARGILVRDRSADPLLQGCLRITLGTLAQTERLIQALKETGG
ncbi:MAG: histidinol-phosphate transaminase [Fibrobacterota bacterium]